MKLNSIFLMVALFVATLFSCHDDCTQTAFCTQVSSSSFAKSSGNTTICHYDADSNTYVTISVDDKGLKGHQNHPNDDLTGACSTLSSVGLTFSNGEYVEIDCKYDLPFVYKDDNGVNWLFE